MMVKGYEESQQEAVPQAFASIYLNLIHQFGQLPPQARDGLLRRHSDNITKLFLASYIACDVGGPSTLVDR